MTRTVRWARLSSAGFIGLPVALTLSRAGHVVYGTTRDAKAARKLLAQNEIHPLLVTLATERGDSVWGKIASEVDVGEYELPMAARLAV